MYSHKAITSKDAVRTKFQLELSNWFEGLQWNDTVKTAYDKLEQALNEAASNSLPRKERNTNKPWVSTQSLDLIEQRQATRKKYQNHCNHENYNTGRSITELTDVSLVNDKINKI